jgi:peptide/nickel transport system substrate-binding protein
MLSLIQCVRGVLVFALGAVAAGACAQNLVLGTKLELNTLDPHFFNAFPTGSSHEMLFDALASQDETGAVKPALALSWRLIDDKTWEFKLRPNVKFHDGTPFTADDVLFTLQRVPNVPNSPNSFAQFTRGIEKAEALDPLTIRIRTKETNPNLPLDLSKVFIVSSVLARSATTADFNNGKAAVGTGPYKLVEWSNGERLVVDRNESYWGGKPTWARVTERVIAKDAPRVAALLSGQVDAIDLVPTADLGRFKADARYAVFKGPAAIVHYVALDVSKDPSPLVTAMDGSALSKNPLKDPRVRKALSLATPRQLIVDRLLDGSGVPASQLLPSSFPGTSKKLKPDPLDMARAKELLKLAGWAQGFKLTLVATGDRYPNDAGIAQAIAGSWTRLGLQVAVDTLPGNVFFTRASKQEFAAFAAQYGSDEVGIGARALLASFDTAKGTGTGNRVRYSNVQADALLAHAMSTMEPVKRLALMETAMEVYMADQAFIPVFYPVFDFAAKKGFVVTPRPQRRFNAMMIKPQ